MKGPGLRLDLDVRRVWECPACGRTLKTAGGVTQVDCDCRGERSPAMRLSERRRRTESPFDHAAHAAQKRLDTAMGRIPPDPEEPERPEPADLPDAIPQQAVPLATSEMADEPAVREALAGTEADHALPPNPPGANVLSVESPNAVDPGIVSDVGPGPGGV